MNNLIKTIFLLLLANNASGQYTPSSIDVNVLNYQASNIKLELLTTFAGGPPAPYFLGFKATHVNVDTLFVIPVYYWPGATSTFGSARGDTIDVQIPIGITKIKIHGAMEVDVLPAPNKDTILSVYADTLIHLMALGIDNSVKYSNHLVYPNPTKSMLNIDVPFDNYEVFNLVGSIVLLGNYKPTIDVSMLKEGVYYVRLKSKEEIVITRFYKM